MQSTIAYNGRDIRDHGSKDDIKAGYNIWVDLVNPTPAELLGVHQSFQLDKSALEAYLNKSKKPQVRVLDSQKFTIALDIKFENSTTLATEGVYLFVGRGWLVTIHSDKVDLKSSIMKLFEQKSKIIIESSIDTLFYSTLANLVDSYEQILTAIELTVTSFEQKTLYKPTKSSLEYLDSLSRQIIVLRRHFWHIRDTINFLTHTEEDKEDIKYLKIVYDNINQLIEMLESYRETINSTRELYIASVSLQMSDTMKTLTIFSAILLPLTFISSMYSMNGIDMDNPLSLPAGFSIVAIIMVAITVGMFLLFMKKKWILIRANEGIVDKVGKEHKGDKKTVIESFDNFISGKKNSNESSDQKYSSASDKVAKKTADKIRDSEPD